MGEAGEIFGGGEEAGVSGDAAEDVGVFVLHFALDDALAECASSWLGRAWRCWCCWHFAGGGARATFIVAAFGLDFSLVGGGGDLWASGCWGIESGAGHGEGAEDFALAESVERFSGDALECGS